MLLNHIFSNAKPMYKSVIKSDEPFRFTGCQEGEMAFLAKKLTRSFPLVRIHRTFPILVQHSHFPQERAEISAIFFFLENLMERLFVDQSKSRLGSQPGRVVSSVPNLRKKKERTRRNFPSPRGTLGRPPPHLSSKIDSRGRTRLYVFSL